MPGTSIIGLQWGDEAKGKLVDLLAPEVDARYGAPRNRDGSRAELAIISLGKLGGRELNFSSDLDLMFVYSEEGETDGGGSHGKAVSNQEYFSRLAEWIVRAATEPTEEDVGGRRGVVSWTYEYEAGETREITNAYVISWPADLNVFGVE